MKITELLPLLLLTAGAVGTATGQSPVLDINTTGSGYDSNVDGGIQGDNNELPEDSFIKIGSHWYFTAQTLTTGDELFRTDGTAAGTTLVKDINPGPGSSNVTWMTSYFGFLLFFSANDGTNGTELWVSDGTPAGTVMLKDINPGAGSSNPARLTVWNGLLWFAADDGVNGTEVWRSDASPGGTNLFVDLRAAGSSTPQNFTPLPGGATMMFRANDGFTGTEPYVTDGTALGTTILADINSGSGSSTPSGFVTMGSRVYFSASNGATNGTELWSTDGTLAGTTMVADIRPGSSSSSPDMSYATVFNGELYFEANDGVNGSEVWKTDGITTTMVWDVAVGSDSSNPSDFRIHAGELYFTADDATVVGRELRKIDAGGVQTTLGDIRPGTGDAFLFSSNNLFSFNGSLFFKVNDGTTGAELGVSNGITHGVIADLESGTTGSDPDWFTPINATQLMFVADTSANGQELWVTNGTLAGTNVLVEIDSTILTADGQPEDMVSFNGKDLLFVARTDTEGEELWRWDPATGASMVMDIRPGSSASSISNLTYAWINGADVVLFTANDGTNGTELWRTDGTLAGTTMVKDIFAGASSGSPTNLTYYNGLVYFGAFDGINGNELWVTDGTAAGTMMVADIQVGSSSSAPQIFCVHDGKLFFRANDGGTGVGSGNELWVTDGTAAGTMLVADIRPGGAASTPNFLTSFNGMLVFTANDGTNGTELWMTDGTAAGTSMVVDIAAGSFSGNPQFLTVLDGELFFRADDNGAVGNELWKTDLTVAGTVPFDLNVGAGDSNPSFLTAIGDKLYFNATDGSNGLEPWTSDGTLAGTTMLADLNPGTGSSSPDDFSSARNGAYFTASGPLGNELWFTDGTAAGTVMLADINPGTASSNPSFLAMASGRLFFQADDPVIGRELFALDPAGAYARSIGHSGDGSTLVCSAPIVGQLWSWTHENVPVDGLGVGFSLRAFCDPLDNGSNVFMDGASSSWGDLFANPSVLEWSLTANGSAGVIIPNNPVFVGHRAVLQSFTLPATLLPISSSNAMSVVLGN